MLPQRSHITRKRGVYYYRRRLPDTHRGELGLSLLTKRFREAEHLAGQLDRSFHSVIAHMPNAPDSRAMLREKTPGRTLL